ncbi:cysteine desulfurase-like protein [Actinophytocola xanthii]|uniref:Cysteine desulfurase-like protein n=1 Tax=Actinophytocola xanthii TaxID=1912961 RepID=A0A1Q8CT84_9PSEU|nr:cysteine desulfurase-like protein [Actinophytocola xanthii]OLF17556.1 cysteine desulfurase-like protein [Actinophytocola xanthii]
MSYDVAEVRARFPALAEGAAHFDGPGGSQTPDAVAEAVAGVLRSAVANRGRVTRAERRADDIVLAARQAAADLVGGVPDGVVFGHSMTQLTYDFARTLAKNWGPGDEVVVTRLDHDANVRPWVQAATAVGAAVHWAGFDRESGVLSVADVAAAISPRTRLVAVTAASNLLGSRPAVAEIAAAARAVGGLTYVDGVHLTAHDLVSVEELGADFYACSPYKFLGPHLGFLHAAPELLEQLHPDKLLPATDAVPERFEFGTLPYEALAGTTAAIDFLADLVPADGSRRERLTASLTALATHEAELLSRLDKGLAAIPGVTRFGDPNRPRTPTVLFTVDGVPPAEVHRRLAERNVNAPAGTFYALECARWLGIADTGAVRAGIAPYTDESDVDRLLAGVTEITGS